jgi:hypothetical protein
MRGSSIAVVALLASLLACGRSAPVVVSQTVQTGATPAVPTEPPVGTSRFNPAPPGAQVQIDNLSLSITEVVFPADSDVRQGSPWNPTPEPSANYILVGIAATCHLPADSSCRLSGLEFSLIDTAGIGHNPRLLIAGVPGKFEGGEFFGGATKEGYLIFVVDGEPADYVLKYEALFGREAYLQLD